MADSAGVIAEGIRIKGELSGSGALVIEGEVEGRIDLQDHLLIQPGGVVNAEIQVDQLTIHGRASGTINADKRVEVRSSATVVGEISAPSIVIEEGAAFRGSVRMDVGIPEDL